MTLKERYQIWRLKPGMRLAAKLAEQQAWKHPNASMLGAEMNLMGLAADLGSRVMEAEAGNISALCMDATLPIARVRYRVPVGPSGERT